MRGTLLNTATVAVGATVGLALGYALPTNLQEVALQGLGLVTLGLGLKMSLGSKNILLVAAAIVFGGVVGRLLGIEVGLTNVAEWMRTVTNGQGSFNEGLITSVVLFCVGPMTLLGCIQDALEGKIELLSLKSLMDGVAAVFLAATLGVGVLASAVLVLVIQGTLTLLARPLRPIAEDSEFVQEASAVGGLMLIGTGFGLLGIAKLAVPAFLPALLLAPVFVQVGRHYANNRAERAMPRVDSSV
jgi:uncharacterized membrane protein YqgA involved in biofilm formation